jgi:hypothetical protein
MLEVKCSEKAATESSRIGQATLYRREDRLQKHGLWMKEMLWGCGNVEGSSK